MTTLISAVCASCGTKYKVPGEAAGKSARCKKCGEKFAVPQAEQSMEDSVMLWLANEDDGAEPDDSRGPKTTSLSEGADRLSDADVEEHRRGPVRFKTASKG